MSFPFRVDGYESPGERHDAIAQSVVDFYADMAERQSVDTAADIPEPLVWLQRVDDFGLIFPGSWANQPYHFMTDIEWAKVGRSRWERIKHINEQASQTQGAANDFPTIQDLLRSAHSGS